VAVISLAVLYRFKNPRVGVTRRAIAQSYLVASDVGITEVRYGVLALAVGCFFVGIGGARFAHYKLVPARNSFGRIYAGRGCNELRRAGDPAILIIMLELVSFLKQYAPYVHAATPALAAFLMPHGFAGPYGQITSGINKRSIYAVGVSCFWK